MTGKEMDEAIINMSDEKLDEAIQYWTHADLKFELDRSAVIELLKEVRRLRKELKKKK